MADRDQYYVTGWNAAAIAAETSEQAALEIIIQLELAEELCDPSDWESLSRVFGSSELLTKAIYSTDNIGPGTAMSQAETMKNALLDLSQSNCDETARRARSALFDGGVIFNEQDGGVQECRQLHQNLIDTFGK